VFELNGTLYDTFDYAFSLRTMTHAINRTWICSIDTTECCCRLILKMGGLVWWAVANVKMNDLIISGRSHNSIKSSTLFLETTWTSFHLIQNCRSSIGDSTLNSALIEQKRPCSCHIPLTTRAEKPTAMWIGVETGPDCLQGENIYSSYVEFWIWWFAWFVFSQEVNVQSSWETHCFNLLS